MQYLMATYGHIAVFVFMAAEPTCLPVRLLTLQKEEQGASKGDLAGLSAQPKAMQAWLEPLAVSP